MCVLWDVGSEEPCVFSGLLPTVPTANVALMYIMIYYSFSGVGHLIIIMPVNGYSFIIVHVLLQWFYYP